jgi:hypothetical protein
MSISFESDDRWRMSPGGVQPILPNWPILLTTELASRYLSVDENTLAIMAALEAVLIDPFGRTWA